MSHERRSGDDYAIRPCEQAVRAGQAGRPGEHASWAILLGATQLSDWAGSDGWP